LIISKNDGSLFERNFYELPEFLREGDLLVFNDSRVFPARLHGKIVGRTEAAIELLLLNQLGDSTWRAIVKPGKRLRRGTHFVIRKGDLGVEGEILEVEENGSRIIKLPGGASMLRELGEVPMPPYIKSSSIDPDRYQTVYARIEGSVAAPTAGLHFTPRLLEELGEKGVELAFVTLHIGWGTFKPVNVENVSDHTMHAEAYTLSNDTANAINRAKSDGRRVVVVGTTAVRVLESLATMSEDGLLEPGSGWTDIFITPGHSFSVMNALITNFHLPRSTLLMLTSAFTGHDLLRRAYTVAVQRRYRFYSLGDAMLIL
jgi:S-adenosylmethionine:tRNA ribosyltransferase-isomerase